MRLILLIAILLNTAQRFCAQRTVDYNGQSHTFKVYLVDSITPDDKPSIFCYVKQVQIYDKLKGELLQTITPPGNAVSCTLPENQLFQLQDINFDGFIDFMIPQFIPAAPNVPYYYWRFHKKAGQFQRDTTLEDITSPNFDQDQKTITSYWKINCCDRGVSTYKYINNELTLVEETETSPDPDNENQQIFTRKKLVNGKLELVEKTIDKTGKNDGGSKKQ